MKYIKIISHSYSEIILLRQNNRLYAPNRTYRKKIETSSAAMHSMFTKSVMMLVCVSKIEVVLHQA